jgi:hypothetical protein
MGRVLAALHKRPMPELNFLLLNDTTLILPTAEFQEFSLMNCSQSSESRIMPVFRNRNSRDGRRVGRSPAYSPSS